MDCLENEIMLAAVAARSGLHHLSCYHYASEYDNISKLFLWYDFERDKSEFLEESNLLVLNKLEQLLTVCKVKNIDDIDLSKEFYFIGKTDEEISLVCETNDVPENTIEREDGWRGFRIQ